MKDYLFWYKPVDNAKEAFCGYNSSIEEYWQKELTYSATIMYLQTVSPLNCHHSI